MGVDVAVYSLSLMGTNVADFVREAWRVLKFNGMLRVAEVRSRFETASISSGDEKRAKLKKRIKHSKIKSQRFRAPQDVCLQGDEDHEPLLDDFLSLLERGGFRNIKTERSNKMFLFLDFVKADGSKCLSDKEHFTVKPCIYKRR